MPFRNFIFSLIILTVGCDSKNQKTLQLIDNNIVSIDSVIGNSIARQTHYNLAEINADDLYSLDSNSVKALFNKRTITSDTSKFTLNYDAYSRYYLFDHVVLKDKFLFTIIHNDEVGYNGLYQFVVDKKKNQICYADLIAITGGDGGDYTNDSLIFNESGDKLTVISTSTYEDIGNGIFNTIQYDSIVRTFNFLLDKRLSKIIHNSSRVDTIVDSK
jgi:hypothetical protein